MLYRTEGHEDLFQGNFANNKDWRNFWQLTKKKN